jgi:hypothetical protein
MQVSQNSLHYTNDYYSSNISLDDASQKSSQEEDKEQKTNSQKNFTELSQDEKKVVYELQARDTEVRAHEAAHQAAGGGLTGGANYSYQRGPDGKMYAIGGEVSISIPKGSTPEEKIANAQQVIAAALAPADPSAQDMSVAASARAMMIEAQQEKAKKAYEEQSSENKDDKKDEEVSSSSIDMSA